MYIHMFLFLGLVYLSIAVLLFVSLVVATDLLPLFRLVVLLGCVLFVCLRGRYVFVMRLRRCASAFRFALLFNTHTYTLHLCIAPELLHRTRAQIEWSAPAR
jgi:hypothetical protein